MNVNSYSKKTFFVRFVYFQFTQSGKNGCKGTLSLFAWEPSSNSYITSSAIIEIYRHDDYVVIETNESLYKFDGRVYIRYLDNVIQYIKDNEYTDDNFYKDCKLRIFNNMDNGWGIF